MLKRNNWPGFAFIFFIAFLLLSSGLLRSGDPELQTNVALSPISQEEFDRIGPGIKLPDAQPGDFRKLTIEVGILNSRQMLDREISIPDVVYPIDHYDRVRSSMAGDYEQNNIGKEDFARSSKYVVFDVRGLTKEDYGKIFAGLNIRADWTYSNGKTVTHTFPIASLLRDES